MNNLATLYVMVGIPGSGKSTISKNLGCVIHSSDSIRFELFGNEEEQGDNNKVFSTLNSRVISSLKNGESCIYDATSISKSCRVNIIKMVKDIPCKKVCVFVDTPLDICKGRNSSRERVVPEYVLDKMMKNLVPPSRDEGWDEIFEVVTI